MSKANDTRGEVSLKLEGEEFVLRPSWDAINELERECGDSVVALAQRAYAGSLRSGEVACIAAACIRAWGRDHDDDQGRIARNVQTDRVGRLIMDSELGLAGVQGLLAVLLSLASTGGYTPSGERKAATKKATTAAA